MAIGYKNRSITGRRRSYIVRRAAGHVGLDGRVAGTPWQEARRLKISNFPWYKHGVKQATTVRVLYDAQAIYLQFHCQDKHISSTTTRLNGSVYKDSCVEFFGRVDGDNAFEYFNLEINCCGTILVGFGSGRGSRKVISRKLAKQITVVTSIARPTKRKSPSDKSWWVAVRLPVAVLRKFTGQRISLRKGARWRANFYRCGGRTDEQYGCWNNIQRRKLDYHRPEQFGELIFG